MSIYGRQDPRKIAAAAGVALALAAGHAARHHGHHHHGHPPASATNVASAAGGSNEQLANRMAAARGWTGAQRTCLDELWTRESNFGTTATNQQSGAYGIPQSLPADKMAAAGSDWQTNPVTQIRWGLSYINGRYGSPCAAWSHEEAVSWY